ncbi:MAG: hypothetical protein ACKVKF_23160, partial [Rhodobacterales bacterium]
ICALTKRRKPYHKPSNFSEPVVASDLRCSSGGGSTVSGTIAQAFFHLLAIILYFILLYHKINTLNMKPLESTSKIATPLSIFTLLDIESRTETPANIDDGGSLARSHSRQNLTGFCSRIFFGLKSVVFSPPPTNRPLN